VRRARSGLGAVRGISALAFVLALGWVTGANAGVAAASSAERSALVDGAELYDAGTAALQRGDLGAAVAFLRAAERVDPRAADLRHNLTEARARAAAGRAGGEAPPPTPGGSLPLTAAEESWIAAALLVLGALLGSWELLFEDPGSAFGNRRRRAIPIAAAGLVAGGALLAIFLIARARQEAVHPQAIVVVPVLEVGPAPDERPRPPYLLGGGEEIRVGRVRGALVEILAGGNSIGWAQRSGVWRVADAARYTPRLP
jgi:hypothetical protein